MNITTIKSQSIETQIYVYNTLFDDNGTFTFNGIYDVNDLLYDVDIEDINQDEYQEVLKDNQIKYYSWINGELHYLTEQDAIKLIDENLTNANVNAAVSNVYNPVDYLKELEDVALTEF